MVNLSLIFCCLSLTLIVGNLMAKDLEPSVIPEMSKKIVTFEDSFKISDLIKGSASHSDEGQLRYIITGGPGAGKTSILVL